MNLAGLHLRNFISVTLAFCVVFPSCTRDKEAIVEAKVAERVDYFKAQKSAECRENLLAAAERRVDSMLLNEAQQSLLDSLARLRPNRPYQPPVVPPIDSFSVKPIFK